MLTIKSMGKNIWESLIRLILFLAGIGFLIIGMAFVWGLFSPWLTSFLIGSSFVSFACATLWIAIFQSYRALVGAALTAVVTFGGSAIYLLRMQNPYGDYCLYTAILALWYFFLGIKASKKKSDFLPLSVHYLFGILLTVTLVEGIYLTLPLSSHFAWILSPEFSVLYGWTLIGGCFFFGWALLSPTWEVGYPLLYAILIFDLFALGPLLTLFRETTPVAVNPVYLIMTLLVILGSAIWVIIELVRRFFIVSRVRI